MANVLEKEWHNYFVQLSETEKKSVLQMIKAFLNERKEKPERISLEEYNKEIDEAIAEEETGNYITQQELEKKAAK